jgi:hypothetical protein
MTQDSQESQKIKQADPDAAKAAWEALKPPKTANCNYGDWFYARDHTTYIDERGYLKYAKSHQLVHRHIAEIMLGRKLAWKGWKNAETEVVHHIDGNKLNNDPENLQIISWENHAILHGRRDYYKGTPKWIRNPTVYKRKPCKKLRRKRQASISLMAKKSGGIPYPLRTIVGLLADEGISTNADTVSHDLRTLGLRTPFQKKETL